MPVTTAKRGNRWATLLISVAAAWLMAGLTCAGGNAAALHQRLISRPIVWHTDRLAVSVEITSNPYCAPLAQVCWVQRPRGRPRYLSVWLYLSSPPGVPWKLSKWHVFVLEVGREERG